MSSEKKKIIISDMYTTISTLKPIKDCNICDFHNDYTCFDHEDEQIKEEKKKNDYRKKYRKSQGWE